VWFSSLSTDATVFQSIFTEDVGLLGMDELKVAELPHRMKTCSPSGLSTGYLIRQKVLKLSCYSSAKENIE